MDEEKAVGTITLTPEQRLECGELFYRSAEKYRTAATTVAGPSLDEAVVFTSDNWIVLYEPLAQLFGQAIELYLKAHLLGQDYSLEQLRNFSLGHKLDQLLQEAMSTGLILGQVDIDRIHTLNTYYASHRLRYPGIDPMVCITPPDLDETCSRLGKVAYPSVHTKARAIGKVTPSTM